MAQNVTINTAAPLPPSAGAPLWLPTPTDLWAALEDVGYCGPSEGSDQARSRKAAPAPADPSGTGTGAGVLKVDNLQCLLSLTAELCRAHQRGNCQMDFGKYQQVGRP